MAEELERIRKRNEEVERERQRAEQGAAEARKKIEEDARRRIDEETKKRVQVRGNFSDDCSARLCCVFLTLHILTKRTQAEEEARKRIEDEKRRTLAFVNQQAQQQVKQQVPQMSVPAQTAPEPAPLQGYMKKLGEGLFAGWKKVPLDRSFFSTLPLSIFLLFFFLSWLYAMT